MGSEHRIHELEARLAELTDEVQSLRASLAAAGSVPEAAGSVPADLGAARSRRNVLKLAGAAAAGSALALASRGGTVAAADGQSVNAGQTVSTSSGSRATTVVEYSNANGPVVQYNGADVTANIFLARDVPTSAGFNPDGAATFPSALAGYAFRAVNNGVYGYTQRIGYGTVGFGAVAGSIGVLASGVKAAAELRPNGGSPVARTDPHNLGELVMDTDGNLWLCVAPGTPATGASCPAPPAPAASTPSRRPAPTTSRVAQPAPGALASGASRTLSVARKRNTVNGADEGVLVPAGASAISCNVTVVNTLAGGFVTLNPGGTTTVDGATVNWSGSGQILNNGVIVRLNDALEVTAVVGGTAATRTDLVIDVTGYFL